MSATTTAADAEAARQRGGWTPSFSWLLIILFAVALATPAAVQLASLRGESVADNRVLAKAPEWLGVAQLREFTRSVDLYVEDHFGLRAALVHINSLARYALGVSSTPKVAIGRDGWLFYANPDEKLLEQHTGMDVFTASELDLWVDGIVKIRDWFSRRGMPLVVVVAPDKPTIYPEMLPAYPRRAGVPTRLDQIAERLRGSDLAFVDPRKAMTEAKQRWPIYQGGDSHWTQYGAWVAYSLLMEHVRKVMPGLEPVRLEDYDSKAGPAPADLAILLGLQNDLSFTSLLLTRRSTHQKSQETRVVEGSGWPVDFIDNDLDNRPRLLVFGDSFTAYVLGPTFLYETFRDPVRTHHNNLNLNYHLVELVKPDIVIIEVAERYLRSIPVPPPGP